LLCSTAKIGKKIMFTLNSNGKQLNINTPLVMGVLNCTDDSFYEGSRSLQLTDLQQRIDKMITEIAPQKSMHTMENGPLMSKSKGAQYANGGEVVVRGTGAARTQKARIC
jgi:hypothetical protein